MTTRSDPKASADRNMVPTFPGSEISNRTVIKFLSTRSPFSKCLLIDLDTPTIPAGLSVSDIFFNALSLTKFILIFTFFNNLSRIIFLLK